MDYILVADPNKDRVQEPKAQLTREFEIKDLELVNKILGMQIHRDSNSKKIWLSTPPPINFKLFLSIHLVMK